MFPRVREMEVSFCISPLRAPKLGVRAAEKSQLRHMWHYGGRFMRRRRSWKRGSERRKSNSGALFISDVEVPSFVGSLIQPMQHFLPILEEPVLEGDE